ncbi:Uncharacterised protein [Streptococcus milleri]|nr:Uncharacterised protein [Streptococcus milleri]
MAIFPFVSLSETSKRYNRIVKKQRGLTMKSVTQLNLFEETELGDLEKNFSCG